MNMREYWAREAEMMRDKSGVLGKEVLMPLGNSSTPKKVGEDFRTGYWLEGNTIVFSTFVYDKFGIGKDKKEVDNKINELMLKVGQIRRSYNRRFEDQDYKFEWRYKILDKQKYDINTVSNLNDLEDGFYMEIVEGIGTGVTHYNKLKPSKSAYFQIKVGDLIKYGSLDIVNTSEVAHIMTHESFHPLIDHPWTLKPMNPLEDTIWEPIKNEIMKFRDLDNLVQGKKNTVASLKANFSQEIKAFTQNIMLSPEMLKPKTDINAYRAECIYEVLNIDIWKEPNEMNKGVELHNLQFEKILNQLK